MLINIIIIVLVLVILKWFFDGTRCNIQRNLQGKIAILTGGNTGIGYQTAKKLCQMGCKVIFGARDQTKSQKAIQQIKKQGKGIIISFHLDLSKKSSIQQFVSNIKSEIKQQGSIDYLINNAATIYVPTRKLTQQGLQMQIGVNHFGHFYLTYLLWPFIKKNSCPRIINVSSKACQMPEQIFKNASIDFSNLNYQNGGYQPFLAYCRSKKANVLFTKQLKRRMKQANFQGVSVSLHPGFVRTEFIRQILSTPFRKIIYQIIANSLMYIVGKSPEQGIQTTMYTLLQREQKLNSDQYQFYVQCKSAKIRSKECNDMQKAQELWNISQKAFNIKFQI